MFSITKISKSINSNSLREFDAIYDLYTYKLDKTIRFRI